jgi:hypothetical protein
MEFTKETGKKMLGDILVRNGFEERAGGYQNDKCLITIFEDHYRVRHYEEAFLEWLDWFSDSLNIPALMGYLSWNDFIERGYKK